ncbi:Diadenosine tetraphosphate (Ap4A) hydrolase [Marinobacter persicus]|uniref:Diadenosine tetraphosphate (Ap4A) hydrolase n=1 Tax=Marinobacter persicus TaxID=930118 RepID=A0A1I3TPC5_9GAMM|nr:HIT family protein [Marinobacter persicus]GHD46036.1 histidine triad domain protein [Marinobacter persicus]SFJ72715.1 Diadenosine tetraphosphate (Ap4A) hydrolase [Marinobacter persicus]
MFELHPKLAADTHHLGKFGLSEVLLMNDSTWPWVILVPAVPDIREIYELSKIQRIRLLESSSILSKGMMDVFRGDKMNVAALGNMVPQLHLHHIVRFENDPAWPAPVWGKQAPVPYTDEALEKMREKLRPVLEKLV